MAHLRVGSFMPAFVRVLLGEFSEPLFMAARPDVPQSEHCLAADCQYWKEFVRAARYFTRSLRGLCTAAVSSRTQQASEVRSCTYTTPAAAPSSRRRRWGGTAGPCTWAPAAAAWSTTGSRWPPTAAVHGWLWSRPAPPARRCCPLAQWGAGPQCLLPVAVGFADRFMRNKLMRNRSGPLAVSRATPSRVTPLACPGLGVRRAWPHRR